MQSPSATADGLWYCKEFDWLTCTVGGSPANYRGSIFLGKVDILGDETVAIN
jgi:hypothetical protein